MSKPGAKELAQRDLQAKKLSRAHEMMLEDGCPPKCLRIGDGPKLKRRDDKSAGVTLAPPIAVQKAIAADLAGSTETERNLAAVANAHHFTCTIFRGHDGYQTARFDTLAEARAYRPTLETEAANHRKAMIYAVTNTGMTHFVPDDLIDPTIPLSENQEVNMAKRATKTSTKSKAKPTKAATRRKATSKAPRKPTAGRYDWAAAAESAKAGKMPTAPDFSASTHDGYRKRFDAVVAMAKAGDLAGLKKDDTKPISGSRKIICRYRDAVIVALGAK